MSRRDNVRVNLDRLHAVDVYRLSDKERNARIPHFKQALAHSVAATVRVNDHDVSGIIRKVATRHKSDQTEAELNAIVDQGCTVVDVIVEHPIYGQITGPLELSSRYDVSQFLLRSAETQPLSVLTEGIHLHTLSCPDEAAFTRVQNALRTLGVLLEE